MNRYDTEEARWRAVLHRDKSAAPHFFYAVATTGVFCLPGCPSRQPNRDNVRFFDTVEDAAKAGFRPCKRCRPDDPAYAHIGSDRVAAACRTMERAEQPVPLDELAAAAGLSPSHFQRLFTDRVGVSPKVYAQAVRDARVRSGLEQGRPVTQAVFDAGYGSASRFYERSGQVLGMAPRAYGKGGKGLSIRYALGESFLGLVLCAFTEHGVCAIEFGEDRADLIQALHDRFPAADIEDGSADLSGLVAEVTAFIKTPDRGLDLPLDIQGTAFQQRVWRALQDIPAGETRTYSDIAGAIGRPKAVRAVAGACAANRLAVAVPCHRVLRKTGELSGYHWGQDRKRALLENERLAEETSFECGEE